MIEFVGLESNKVQSHIKALSDGCRRIKTYWEGWERWETTFCSAEYIHLALHPHPFPTLSFTVMNDRWARFYGSAQGMTLISFCLGLSGSVLGVTTLQWAFKETMTGQLMQWRQDIIHMRQRLEIGGGVPYLLRDQVCGVI